MINFKPLVSYSLMAFLLFSASSCNIELETPMDEEGVLLTPRQSNNEPTNTPGDANPAPPPPAPLGEITSPDGIILAFDLASCPSGWSDFSEGQGRVLMGAGSGSMDELNNPLTSRTLGSTGGLEHKTAYPYSNLGANTDEPDGTVLAQTINPEYRSNLGSVTADSNLMPYKALRFCKKVNDTDQAIPAEAVTSFNNNSCPGDWQLEASLNGRTIIGVGSGNLDSSGAALTARTLGTTGGRETVSGMPIGAEGIGSGATNLVGSGIYPGNASSDVYLATTSVGECLGTDGCLTNPNNAPYVALRYCELTGDSSSTFPATTVAAFDKASCPTGWSLYTRARGRVVVGTGSGNTDSGGSAISNKILNEDGGWEQTNSIPVSSDDADTNISSGNFFAVTAGDLKYHSGGVATSYSDPIADSNIPPFVVVTYCQKDGAGGGAAR